jgi:hypothetical protein
MKSEQHILMLLLYILKLQSVATRDSELFTKYIYIYPELYILRKIWGIHGGDYEACRLVRYKTPVRTSQQTHYVYLTELSQIMLWNMWGYHGGDYEECRLLGYKTQVRTSQETHYVSATEPSQFMLCTIWGLHGGDYEEWPLLGCYAVWHM